MKKIFCKDGKERSFYTQKEQFEYNKARMKKGATKTVRDNVTGQMVTRELSDFERGVACGKNKEMARQARLYAYRKNRENR